MAAVSQLFARLSQEIEEEKPKNCIHFVVDFLCKHYPEHLHGFASIWQMDPDLERERHEVVNFFKAHKISTAVAAHFTNAGYDTLDTLTTLNKESLVDVEAFNNVKWLPGHKVRLQQIFGEIAARVRAYRQQYGNPTSRSRAPGGGASAGARNLFMDLDRGIDGGGIGSPPSYFPQQAAPPMIMPQTTAVTTAPMPVTTAPMPQVIQQGPFMMGCAGVGPNLSTPGPVAVNALQQAAFPGMPAGPSFQGPGVPVGAGMPLYPRG
jgi:hypothetical protein